jgi:hypothetical protein
LSKLFVPDVPALEDLLDPDLDLPEAEDLKARAVKLGSVAVDPSMTSM